MADIGSTCCRPVEALAAMPDTLSNTGAAPWLCAGVTTYNALRRSGALPVHLIAGQGIDGLGHAIPVTEVRELT